VYLLDFIMPSVWLYNTITNLLTFLHVKLCGLYPTHCLDRDDRWQLSKRKCI